MFFYLFGGIALFYIACLLRKPVRALEFDKNTGVFWIEKRRVFGWKVGESAQMPIAHIHALQIVSYTNREAYLQTSAQELPSSTHDSNHQKPVKEYEVNVVFRNGERVNIINHKNKKAIHSDANILGAFLGVPIWDQNQKAAAAA